VANLCKLSVIAVSSAEVSNSIRNIGFLINWLLNHQKLCLIQLDHHLNGADAKTAGRKQVLSNFISTRFLLLCLEYFMPRILIVGLAIALFTLSSCSPTQATRQPSTNSPLQASLHTLEADRPLVELVALLKTYLSAKIGLSPSEMALQSAEAVDWTDSCLGAAKPDEFCLMAITSGYRIVITTSTQTYVFHTDRRDAFREVQQ
jgi:hypothetical protein